MITKGIVWAGAGIALERMFRCQFLTGKSICSDCTKQTLVCGGPIGQETAAKARIDIAASRKRKIGRPRKDVTGGNTGHLKMVDPANPSLANVDKLVADRVVKRSRTA